MIVPGSLLADDTVDEHRSRLMVKAEPTIIGPHGGGSFIERLEQLGFLGSNDRARLPTFMVVSPPKTGTSWLFSILLHHPQVAVPREKETRFFSSFYLWSDLRWYLSRFGDSDAPCRGEATPTYALLPPRMIRLLRELMPELKILFLLRDPVERAWSHARHNWRHGEANFAADRPTLEQVVDEQWFENFAHPWPSFSGDYLGQLRRWRAIFPREQIYVGFFEDIGAEPEKLLAEIFGFLGIGPFQVPEGKLEERVNEGLAVPLPDPLRQMLRSVYAGRTRELGDYLRDEFNVSIPESWSNTLSVDSASQQRSEPMELAAAREFDDEFLASLIEHERPPERPISLSDCYLGYNLFLFRDRVYALAGHLREGFLTAASDGELETAELSGYCFNGRTIAEVKEQLAPYLLRQHRVMTVL